MEVERPKRRHLSATASPTPRTPRAAARAVLAGEAVGEPKSGDGRVEMIRALRIRPPLRAEGQNAGRQPAPGPAGDGARGPSHRLRALSTKELVARGCPLPPRR